MRSRPLPIAYSFTILIGLGIGLLFALKTYLMYWYWGESEKYVFQRHGLVPIVNYGLWGLLMPLAYFFISRFKVGKDQRARDNLLAVGSSFLMAFTHETISNVVYYLPLHVMGLEPFRQETLQFIVRAFPSAFISRLIEYWILYGIINGLEFQQKFQDKQLELAQLENQLSSAQLSALRLQLQPHFLFNTLNTISSLMEIDVKAAQRIVSRLGSLLRTVLDRNKRPEVELREELLFVRNYLDIEQIRFQDRLNIRYEVDDDTLSCPVPALILQPLVENAVKHGFSHNSGSCQVLLKAWRRESRLYLLIFDDGEGADQPLESLLESGAGLKNVKDRLDLIYKNDYQLLIESSAEKGFTVTVIIPCQPGAEKHSRAVNA